MTNIIKTTAIAVLLSAPAAHWARGAEPTVVAFSCDGRIFDARSSLAKPQPVNKMGLVVNLAERTVSGFQDVVAHIDKIDAADIAFSGTGSLSAPDAPGIPVGSITVMGSIHRASGAVSAKTTTTAATFTYDLLCKPANRAF
jgi:hypothetical protein